MTIIDERNISISEAVFKNGALLRLTCQVRQADRDNFMLHWKLGSSVLNHDTQRGGVRYPPVFSIRFNYYLLPSQATESINQECTFCYIVSRRSDKDATPSAGSLWPGRHRAIPEFTPARWTINLRRRSRFMSFKVHRPLLFFFSVASCVTPARDRKGKTRD